MQIKKRRALFVDYCWMYLYIIRTHENSFASKCVPPYDIRIGIKREIALENYGEVYKRNIANRLTDQSRYKREARKKNY